MFLLTCLSTSLSEPSKNTYIYIDTYIYIYMYIYTHIFLHIESDCRVLAKVDQSAGGFHRNCYFCRSEKKQWRDRRTLPQRRAIEIATAAKRALINAPLKTFPKQNMAHTYVD